MKVGVGAAVGQGVEVVTIRQFSDEDCIICYIPISSGKKVVPGMEVIVCPTTINRQEYGHMKADVVAVDDYVTPASSIRNALGDDTLAQAFTQNGPVVAVSCRLRTDENTASGYWWSSKKGADLMVADGTLVSADIVTEKKAPITMLIPYLKEKLSSAVEPAGKEER
jgi:NHLM bacteriocin system secretion protein